MRGTSVSPVLKFDLLQVMIESWNFVGLMLKTKAELVAVQSG